MTRQNHDDRERPIGSDALTDKERAVLRLADAGKSREDIAALTGIKPHRVASIQRNYADSGRDAWKADAVHGSFLLARAINAMRARRPQPKGLAA